MEGKISLIFSKIGTTIKELMGFAYSDFMGLNSQFKEIASQTNQFIIRTQELMDMVHQVMDLNSTSQHKLLEEELDGPIRPSHNIIQLNSSLSHLIDQSHCVRIHLKSLNQDLLTLKYLIVSYQVSGLEQPQLDLSSAKMQANIELLGDYKLDTHCSYKQLHEAVAHTVKSVNRINRINRPINNAYSQLGLSVNMLNRHSDEVEARFEQIAQLLSTTKRDMAQIITNLQFHDIIEQKMNHMLQSHETIISSNAQNLSEVKSIASIQSAILIKTNQEYQHSIENIIALLKGISHHIAQAFSILNDVLASQLNLFSTTTQPAPDKHTLLGMFQEVREALAELQGHIAAIAEASSSRPSIDRQAVESTKQWLQHTASMEAADMAIIPQQLITVLDGVEGIAQKLDSTMRSITTTASEMEHVREAYARMAANSHPTLKAKGKISKQYAAIMKSTADSLEQIRQQHTDNDLLRQLIGGQISHTINNIQYYEMFEQKISNITNMLNEVFREIKDGTATPDKLEQIKELYTMQSEHSIHSSVLAGAAIGDGDDEDFGDVELF